MKVAFTICSNNYLGKAISLYKSLIEHNKDYKFIICLADKPLNDEVYNKYLGNIEVVSFMDLGIKDFEDMVNKYSIVELNTAIKPFFAEYLINKHPGAELVIYFDPDIMVYAPLTRLEESLSKYDIVLTPHFSTAVGEKIHDFERIVLKVGIYNLGFIAMKPTPNVIEMLKWWQTRLKEECSIDFNSGLFVDQIWINYVPLYFKNVLIDSYPGYNMAYWNFYERTLTNSNNKFYANNELLVFFHFSGFNTFRPDIIFKGLKYSFEARPDLKPLYGQYMDYLLENGHNYFKKLTTHYDKKTVYTPTVAERIKKRVLRVFSRK